MLPNLFSILYFYENNNNNNKFYLNYFLCLLQSYANDKPSKVA